MTAIRMMFWLSQAWLMAVPAEAATLTSGTLGVSGIDRVSCGVTYKGDAPIDLTVQIFDQSRELLAEPLELSPDVPSSWWRTAGCAETGCVAPWCKVTVASNKKKKVRAALCVESGVGEGEAVVYTPIGCVPVD